MRDVKCRCFILFKFEFSVAQNSTIFKVMLDKLFLNVFCEDREEYHNRGIFVESKELLHFCDTHILIGFKRPYFLARSAY